MVAEVPLPRLTGLTGRTGYRRNLRGHIILQVEYGIETVRPFPYNGREEVVSRWTRWRDAAWQDLVALHIQLRPAPAPRAEAAP